MFLCLFVLNLGSSLFPVLLNSKVEAADTVEVTYINFGTIQVKHDITGDKLVADQTYNITKQKGDSYVNVGPNQRGYELFYTPEGDRAGEDNSGKNCVPSIVLKGVDENGLPNNREATLYLKKGDGQFSERCSVIKKTVTIKNFQAGSRTLFNWKNADVIQPVSVLPYIHEVGSISDEIRYQSYGAFIKQPSGNFVNKDNQDDCKSFIDQLKTSTGRVSLWNRNDKGNCPEQFNSRFSINIGNVLKQADPSNGDLSGGIETGSTTDSSSEDGGGPGLDCKVGANPLNWLLCGAVNGMVNIVGTLDRLINSLLSVGTDGTSSNPSQIFGGNGDETYNLNDATAAKGTESAGYYNAWSIVRNISLGLMVLVGLTIIIAQALGTELVDAYTLRKALPRFIIAAIAITLSWQLLQFMVSVTNQLGLGIRFIIYEPFSGVINDLGDLAGPVGGIGVYVIGSAAVYALGIFGLLSFAATAALALLVAFLILVLRQIIIIVLIIFAPIAIAAYVLPNTQKFYKIWWESLEKALLMFPIIAAMIASGRVFSAVSLSGNPNAIEQLIGFAAYFAPYFAIPFALKFAGGALSTIGGFTNNMNRGGFDRLKNYRAGKFKSNMEKGKNYQRLSDRNSVTRGINNLSGALSNPRQVAGGLAGIRAGRRAGRFNQGTADLKADPIMAANDKNDNFLLALADENLANEKLDRSRKKLATQQQAYNTASAAGDQAGMDEANNDMLGTRADITAREGGISAARQVQSRNSAGTRLHALNALAQTGYQFDSGDAGYRQLESTVKSITGGDQVAFSDAMDSAQFHLKGAGRSDLGGINHGSGKNAMKDGIRKKNSYARGQDKGPTYHGGAAAWLGSGTVSSVDGTTKTSPQMSNAIVSSLTSGETSYKDVSEYHEMLANDYAGATDANKLEIQKQMDAIGMAARGVISDPSPTTVEETNARQVFMSQIENNEIIKSRGQLPFNPNNVP